MLRLGINIGKSSIASVIMDKKDQILSAANNRTSFDLNGELGKMLDNILKQSDIHPQSIKAVMVGTNYCSHALMNRKQLASVCAIRIGQSKGSVPPLFNAPDALRQAIDLKFFELSGGHEVDGSESGSLSSKQELEMFLGTIPTNEIDAFAICSAFSQVCNHHEQEVMNWIRKAFDKEYSFNLSHELGNIGFIERENATILNATLSKVMVQANVGLEQLLREYGISAPIFFTQNDSFLMSYDYALRFPIRTLESSTANCFRGGAFLAKLNDCIIVSVEKNVTYVGMMEEGFLKEIGRKHQIDSIYVNIRMPEIVRLPFGEDNPVDDEVLERLYQIIQRFQPRYEPLPIVFVGKGCAELASRFNDPWSDIIQPPYYEHAGAIGACISPISGCIDQIYSLETTEWDDVMEQAKKEAIRETVRAGANPKTVLVQTIKATPLAYIPSNILRIQARAIGSFA